MNRQLAFYQWICRRLQRDEQFSGLRVTLINRLMQRDPATHISRIDIRTMGNK